MYTKFFKTKIENMQLRERINYGYKKVIIMMLISGILSIAAIGMLFASLVHYVNKINEMAKDNPNIIMTGFVSGNILEELFSNAYMYVLPSEYQHYFHSSSNDTGRHRPFQFPPGRFQ